jgi:hypothetical protein
MGDGTLTDWLDGAAIAASTALQRSGGPSPWATLIPSAIVAIVQRTPNANAAYKEAAPKEVGGRLVRRSGWFRRKN